MGIGWLILDRLFEGPILVKLTPDHGIVAADLLSATAFCSALVLLVRARR